MMTYNEVMGLSPSTHISFSQYDALPRWNGGTKERLLTTEHKSVKVLRIVKGEEILSLDEVRSIFGDMDSMESASLASPGYDRIIGVTDDNAFVVIPIIPYFIHVHLQEFRIVQPLGATPESFVKGFRDYPIGGR